MKILNKENQDEIGFDIDCLPKWANYICKDPMAPLLTSDWNAYEYKPEIAYNSFWSAEGLQYWIYKEEAPSRYKGDWKDSLFKIERI